MAVPFRDTRGGLTSLDFMFCTHRRNSACETEGEKQCYFLVEAVEGKESTTGRIGIGLSAAVITNTTISTKWENLFFYWTDCISTLLLAEHEQRLIFGDFPWYAFGCV